MKIDSATAAVIKNGTVTNVIVVNRDTMQDFKEKVLGDECDYLILVDDVVELGDTYDPDTGIFYRDGERIFPTQQMSEVIEEMQGEIAELKATIESLKTDLNDTVDQMAKVTANVAQMQKANKTEAM